ncbi:hypothetical protein AHAS_Ahas08G0028400 [Arachis hypogaea]
MKDVLKGTKKSHYYLMAVDVSSRRTWIFDSFPTQETIKGRISAVKSVATVLDKILRTMFPDLDVFGRNPPLSEWNPDFVLGITNESNWYKVY